MRLKTKAYATTITAFLVFSLAMASRAAGAGSLTLPSTPQAPGGSVSVSGTGFGATSAVGIGFGAEVSVTNELCTPTGSGLGPYTGTLANRPIKPGTFTMNVDANAGLVNYDVIDNGVGGLQSSSPLLASGTIDYVTGQYSTYSSMVPTDYTIIKTARYTRYQYNVTPATNITTNVSGSFSANITVPSVANGNYNVTAIEASGKLATSSLSVDIAIPEGLTIGVMVLLSSFAVLVSSRHFRKPPRIPN